MKVVITGGHISPAIAVIEKLSADTQIVFIGRKHVFEGDQSLSYEYREITERNIPFYNLKTGRLQRVITPHTLTSLFRIPSGIWSAYTILKKEKPDCVLSFGGYIGLPVVIAGFLLNIPVVIHEQTFNVGFSNSIASKFATKICISWEQSEHLFPKEKIVLTGNPLRKSFFEVINKKPTSYKKPMLYITGGSAGSHQVNALIEQYLEELLELFIIIHQTGDTKQYRDFERLSEKRERFSKDKQERYRLFKFTSPDESSTFMNDATLVIGRSGINTVTELIYLKKKAYLIPLTHGQKGEQMTNALFLKNKGLAEIYTDPSSFVSDIKKMAASDTYSLKSSFDISLIEHASEKIVSVLSHVSKKS